MIGDVFEEHEPGLALSYDPGGIGPEVAGVLLPGSASRDAERLTRISHRDNIHDSVPRAAIEGLEIVPDRREIQGLVFHPRHESSRGVGFPLNVTDSSIGVSKGDMEPEFEAPNPGTKSQAIHVLSKFFTLLLLFPVHS